MVDEATTQTPLTDSPPAGAPSVEGLEQGEIATMLGTVNQGGNEAAGTEKKLEGALDDPKIEEKTGPNQPDPAKKPEFEVPDKFKNQDGSLNGQNITKSYADLESNAGKVRAELGAVKSEAENMSYQLDDLTAENDDLRAQIADMSRPEMTDEDKLLMQENPEMYAKKVEATLKDKTDRQGAKQRQEDSRMNAMASKCRAELDGFKELEGEIAKLSESNVYSRIPQAIKEMYYACLGRKTADIQKEARAVGEKAGYDRAKVDLSKHVEVGGKHTAVSDIGTITQEQIDGMSQEELAAVVKNHMV